MGRRKISGKAGRLLAFMIAAAITVTSPGFEHVVKAEENQEELIGTEVVYDEAKTKASINFDLDSVDSEKYTIHKIAYGEGTDETVLYDGESDDITSFEAIENGVYSFTVEYQEQSKPESEPETGSDETNVAVQAAEEYSRKNVEVSVDELLKDDTEAEDESKAAETEDATAAEEELEEIVTAESGNGLYAMSRSAAADDEEQKMGDSFSTFKFQNMFSFYCEEWIKPTSSTAGHFQDTPSNSGDDKGFTFGSWDFSTDDGNNDIIMFGMSRTYQSISLDKGWKIAGKAFVTTKPDGVIFGVTSDSSYQGGSIHDDTQDTVLGYTLGAYPVYNARLLELDLYANSESTDLIGGNAGDDQPLLEDGRNSYHPHITKVSTTASVGRPADNNWSFISSDGYAVGALLGQYTSFSCEYVKSEDRLYLRYGDFEASFDNLQKELGNEVYFFFTGAVNRNTYWNTDPVVIDVEFTDFQYTSTIPQVTEKTFYVRGQKETEELKVGDSAYIANFMNDGNTFVDDEIFSGNYVLVKTRLENDSSEMVTVKPKSVALARAGDGNQIDVDLTGNAKIYFTNNGDLANAGELSADGITVQLNGEFYTYTLVQIPEAYQNKGVLKLVYEISYTGLAGTVATQTVSVNSADAGSYVYGVPGLSKASESGGEFHLYRYINQGQQLTNQFMWKELMVKAPYDEASSKCSELLEGSTVSTVGNAVVPMSISPWNWTLSTNAPTDKVSEAEGTVITVEHQLKYTGYRKDKTSSQDVTSPDTVTTSYVVKKDEGQVYNESATAWVNAQDCEMAADVFKNKIDSQDIATVLIQEMKVSSGLMDADNGQESYVTPTWQCVTDGDGKEEDASAASRLKNGESGEYYILFENSAGAQKVVTLEVVETGVTIDGETKYLADFIKGKGDNLYSASDIKETAADMCEVYGKDIDASQLEIDGQFYFYPADGSTPVKISAAEFDERKMTGEGETGLYLYEFTASCGERKSDTKGHIFITISKTDSGEDNIAQPDGNLVIMNNQWTASLRETQISKDYYQESLLFGFIKETTAIKAYQTKGYAFGDVDSGDGQTTKESIPMLEPELRGDGDTDLGTFLKNPAPKEYKFVASVGSWNKIFTLNVTGNTWSYDAEGRTEENGASGYIVIPKMIQLKNNFAQGMIGASEEVFFADYAQATGVVYKLLVDKTFELVSQSDEQKTVTVTSSLVDTETAEEINDNKLQLGEISYEGNKSYRIAFTAPSNEVRGDDSLWKGNVNFYFERK
jgi:hypothetical protein